MQKRVFLAIIIVLLLLVGLLPVFSMLVNSLGLDSHFSFVAYEGVLTSRHQWVLMGHSMALSSIVTVFAVAVGVPLGILFGKTDFPFRSFFMFLFAIPLLIPPYITAVSWFDLLGREGLLAPFMGPQLTAAAGRFLFGLPGSALVLFSTFLSIPMILTMVFLKAVNPRLEEAGLLASGWRGVLKGITIPLILPGILLSAILVFLLSFGEFGVPNFLRYDVFPVESFTQFSAFYNFKAATAAAVPLAALTLAILAGEVWFLRKKGSQLRPSPDAATAFPIPLGKYRRLMFSSATVLGLVLVVLPFSVLVIQSAGIKNYVEAFNRAGDSIVRSILYAASGAVLLTFIGFFTGYLIQTKAVKFWRTIDFITIFLFALPGTVIGIGLVSLWNRPWANLIYGTSAIIILGYLARYTALTSRICATRLSQIPPSMEEAAQVAGAGWFRRMILIVAPLARRSIFAAFIVGYIFSLRDTGITMLVYPAGHDTLPVRIFTLMANGSSRLIAALCIIMIAITIVPAAILWAISRPVAGKEMT
ncbi:MAG: iron ABC transporter permease [Acidobacteria bacterium]|nr:iron ABC transporter permease [Acidobacteriota bacterium]